MITPMLKYGFLVYHLEYESILSKLRDVGVLHIETIKENIPEEAEAALRRMQKMQEVKRLLSSKNVSSTHNIQINSADELLHKLDELKNKEAEVEKQKKEIESVVKILKPWGEIPGNRLQILNDHKIFIHFFTCTKNAFNEKWLNEFVCYISNADEKQVWFFIISDSTAIPDVKAEYINIQQENLADKLSALNDLNEQLQYIAAGYRSLAGYISLIDKEIQELDEQIDWNNAIYNTYRHNEGRLMLLQAWVPEPDAEKLNALLDRESIAFNVERPKASDKVPIKLINRKFSSLFQPIGNLFSLPDYAELDLTPYFAPFFTLFFGMCLGDAGYGLIILSIIAFLRFSSKGKAIKPLLKLGFFLGSAAILFGVLTGTVFGVSLATLDYPPLQNLKDKFLNVDQLFSLSLIIGVIQILFGMGLRAFTKGKMFGFSYALSPIGWILGIIGLLLFIRGSFYIPSILLICIGVFLIVVFSDPEKGIMGRLGMGLWDLYNITGLFGDVLSYVRLFALGLSSSILGLVVNNIAFSILGGTPVISHLFFIIILLFGHGLNFGISTLSAFVHPVRLTFVEFYKNAGFIGGGQEYKPFKSKKIKLQN